MTSRLARRSALLAPGQEPAIETFVALVRTCEAYAAEALKFFQQFGITSQQFNVLRILYVRSSTCGCRCSDIAERMINREPDMTRLVDRLEKAELIERNRCTEDRRVVWIKLTEKGFDLVEEIHPALLAFHRERIGAALTEVELETLRLLLEKVAATCPS